MDEQIKTISPGKALADVLVDREYGEIIHRQEIEEITGKKWKTSPYYDAISRANTVLTESGKRIASIGKSGDYQILYPGDYSDAYVREVKRAKKCVARGGKILKGAPVNSMTLEERRKYNDVSDFHSRMEAQLTGSYVEVKRLIGKKPHPLAT